MAVVTPTPKTQFLDAAGVPLAGGKLYTYVAGTTTPQATYTDSTGSTPNSNPVVLDSRGEANVWLGEATYKFKLTDANDVEIWTVDYISAPTTSVSAVLTGNVTISSDSSGPALKITQTGTGDVMRVQDSADPDSTPFVINSSGLVGLGTVAPAEALDIDNDGKIQFSSSGTARMVISADATNSTIDVKADRNLVVKTNATTILTVNDADVTATVPVVLPAAPTTTLQAATKGYVDGLTGAPAGIISAFAGGTAPTGWLACNGAAVSRTTYATLFAAIGTTWGAGDGVNTFNLPDLRGMFLRGTGTNGTGSSSGTVGPAVGTYNADTYLNHNHTATSSSSVSDPGHTHQYTNSTATPGPTWAAGSGYTVQTPNTASSTTGITVSTSTTVATSTTGGTETRPRNYGILYIIKI
jgi:microcystin-dependent protein